MKTFFKKQLGIMLVNKVVDFGGFFPQRRQRSWYRAEQVVLKECKHLQGKRYLESEEI